MKMICFLLLTIVVLYCPHVVAQYKLTYTAVSYTPAQIDSLEHSLNHSKDGRQKVSTYAALIYAYRKITPLKALSLGEEALHFARQKGDREGLADVLTELGKAYDHSGSSEKALACFDEALLLRVEMRDVCSEGILLNYIGQSYFDAGNYPVALKYYLKSLDVFKSIDDFERISIVENDIGIVNNFIGNYEVALTYYFSALRIKEGRAPKLSLANTLANIGDVYTNLKNYATAEVYFKRSLRNAPADRATLLILNKLAQAISEMGRIDEAKAILREAQQKIGPNESKVIRSFTFMNFGKVFLRAEQLDSAYDMFAKALAVYKTYEAKNGRIEASNLMAYIFIKQGKVAEAIALLTPLLPVADSLKIKDKLRETNEYLSLAYEKTGDFNRALFFRKQANALKDSIDNGQKTAIIMAAQLQYETEQKNKEIALLTRENEFTRQIKNFWLIISVLFVGITLLVYARFLLKKKNLQMLEQKNQEIKAKNELLEKTTRQLEESVATKDKFFSIISHDLKNPFNTILLISSMLEDTGEHLTEEEVQKAGKDLHKTAANAYRLLENLLEWSRIQRQAVAFSPSHFIVAELVSSVVDTLEETARAKNISLVHHVEIQDAVYADKNMVELILRNLLTNAIKFSFPGSTVEVLGKTEEKQFILSVKDTGVGISESVLQKLFRIDANVSSRGTAQEPGTGLGLILCKEMAEMHKGTITVHSEPEKGSTFILSLPGLTASSS